MIMDKLLDLKKVIQDKLENCRCDLIHQRQKRNLLLNCECYSENEYNSINLKIERLIGECESYIDVLRTIEYLEVK